METAKMIECAKKVVDVVFTMPVVGNLLGTRQLGVRLKLLYPVMQKEPSVIDLPEKDKSQVFDLASKMIVARF